MNIDYIMTFTALLMQAAALTLWVLLARKIERWVWLMVLAGFFAIFAHRLADVLHFEPFSNFSHITATVIALVALVAVLQARYWVSKRERLTTKMAAIQARLEQLAVDTEAREPIATRIAEILSDLREEITYYEAQALEHHLPQFKNGGTDRARSG